MMTVTSIYYAGNITFHWVESSQVNLNSPEVRTDIALAGEEGPLRASREDH